MSLLPTIDDLTHLGEQIKTTKLLAEPATMAEILSSDTVFATIAFSTEVTGPLRENFERSAGNKLQSWTWEGIDENNINVGYLSHNGTHLRFQTKEATVFDSPFVELKIEAHGLGLLISTPLQQFAVGNYMAVNEQLSPASKMNYNFGGESTIWMSELGNLGVVDKAAWQKSRLKGKWFMFFWVLLVIALSVWVLNLKK